MDMAESDRRDKEITSWNPFRELEDIQNRMS